MGTFCPLDELFTLSSVQYYYDFLCMVNVSQHIERYQLSEDWILSYGDAKSKYLKI